MTENMENKNELEFYNSDVKEQFINTYNNEETRIPYSRIFKKSKPFEEKNKKDLYNFDIVELKEFLTSLNPLTAAASRTNGRIVSAYNYWAVNQGLTKTKFNSLNDVDPEWFEQFVNSAAKLYVTNKELVVSIEGRCQNPQDQVIFRLLFEGVQGAKDCAEICNLREKDIDFDTNTLTLTDYDGSTRELVVSDRCIKIISDALDSKEYYKKNGEMETDSHLVNKVLKLVDNDYVVKNTISRTDRYESVEKNTLYRRITVIRETTGFPNLTVKGISRSGMMWKAKQLMDQNNGELTKQHLQDIAKDFKVKTIYNLTDFLNEETINTLYNS